MHREAPRATSTANARRRTPGPSSGPPRGRPSLNGGKDRPTPKNPRSRSPPLRPPLRLRLHLRPRVRFRDGWASGLRLFRRPDFVLVQGPGGRGAEPRVARFFAARFAALRVRGARAPGGRRVRRPRRRARGPRDARVPASLKRRGRSLRVRLGTPSRGKRRTPRVLGSRVLFLLLLAPRREAPRRGSLVRVDVPPPRPRHDPSDPSRAFASSVAISRAPPLLITSEPHSRVRPGVASPASSSPRALPPPPPPPLLQKALNSNGCR